MSDFIDKIFPSYIPNEDRKKFANSCRGGRVVKSTTKREQTKDYSQGPTRGRHKGTGLFEALLPKNGNISNLNINNNYFSHEAKKCGFLVPVRSQEGSSEGSHYQFSLISSHYTQIITTLP